MTRLTLAAALTTLTLGTAACTKGDPSVELAVTPTTFALGEPAVAEVTTTNFTLASDEHAHGDVPRDEGHFHLYLDSFETEPLYQGFQARLDILITKAQTSPGEHTLLVRLHTLDHKILEPQVTDSVVVTLTDPTGSGSGSGGSGSGGSGSGG